MAVGTLFTRGPPVAERSEPRSNRVKADWSGRDGCFFSPDDTAVTIIAGDARESHAQRDGGARPQTLYHFE